MESIYNATSHGINGIITQQLDKQQVEATGNNSTMEEEEEELLGEDHSSLYISRAAAIYQGKRKEKPNTNQANRHQHQPIGWDAFQTRRSLMDVSSIS